MMIEWLIIGILIGFYFCHWSFKKQIEYKADGYYERV